jgi:Holliday junction DNA helicase RuvA
MMNAPPEPPPAPAAEPAAKSNGKKAKGKVEAETAATPAPSEPQPYVTAADGQLIEDIYMALMGLGYNPMEARSRLDGLLTCGKPFASVQDAFGLIFAQKG